MIKVENVSKSFNGNLVLKDVFVEFETGKTNLIIGQSGSGKTVLLNCIVGLHEIDNGEIYYGNKQLTKMSLSERKGLYKEMGMLFQGSALFDSSTVEENVMFPLDMFSNMSYEEKKDRVNFCLNRVKIENANHLFPAELSGGMQKRVAIARAIVHNPKFLFCDEPNSGLDPRTSIVIDNLISEITHEFGITTVINTHDMNSVLEIGEKIVFIYQGNKEWEGDKTQVFSSKNEIFNDFVFASNLAKEIKKVNN